MSALGIGFKRMVLGLPHGPGHKTAVDVAADLAEFLHIELARSLRRRRNLAGARRIIRRARTARP